MSLSDKRYVYNGEFPDGTPQLNRIIVGDPLDGDLLFAKDVRKAVRLLKGKLVQTKGVTNADLKVLVILIDEIFGEKLT